MTGAFLRVRGLTKRFGDTLAVDSVDLDVEKGHTYALLGPSGCGKTTTLRLIAGFEQADAGSIELGDQTLSNGSTFLPAEKRRIGMVFQDYALFPHLTVESNVVFGVRERGDRRKRAQEVLEVVGLAGYGSRMPHELSGGQQQRVALARSLAVRPELVLLDEPFSNLDPAMRARVRAEIKGIIESLGITAVFVTHDQEEALSIAERVAVMLDGRIEQVGEPSEIYNHPSTRAVAEFLGDANFFEGEVRAGDLAFELGTVPVSTPLNGQVNVMVRPEALSLTPDAGIEVEVERCEYFGHDQLIHVRLPSGAPAKVRTLNVTGLTPGQHVGLELRGDVVLYANGG